MRVIVAGSRVIDNYDIVAQAIKESGFVITDVVSGAHQSDVIRDIVNVDTMGAKWGYLHMVPVKFFPADWNQYGNAAGPIRNREMAEYANALILLQYNNSKGSASMLKEAKMRKLRIFAPQVYKDDNGYHLQPRVLLELRSKD